MFERDIRSVSSFAFASSLFISSHLFPILADHLPLLLIPRKHAKSLDLKFDSSGIRNRTTTARILVDPKTGEKGIFDRLSLKWLEPWERCADI